METIMQYITAQIFTIISYIFLGTTYHAKYRKTVLILNCFVQISFGISYILLKAWSGIAMSIVALIRNILFLIYNNKSKNKAENIILLVTYIFCIILAIPTYEGIISLLPVLATMLYTYAICQKDIKRYKLLGIPIELLWTFYNIYIKSIFGILLEIVALINCVTGYIMEVKRKRKEL